MPPRVWLDENYDKIIRDNKEFQERMNCIINDPVKTSLVEQESNRESGGTGFQPVQEFSIYRRNLPHWERVETRNWSFSNKGVPKLEFGNESKRVQT